MAGDVLRGSRLYTGRLVINFDWSILKLGFKHETDQISGT